MKLASIVLAAAAMAIAPFAMAAAAPAAAPSPALSIGDVLPICEKGLEAALAGHDAEAAVMDQVRSLPDQQQRAVHGVCGIYIAGAVAMLKHLRAPDLPAGKGVAI